MPCPLPETMTMAMRDELELLDQLQTEAEQIAEEVEYSTGVDRREFVLFTLAAAAATTFGFGARAIAQPPAGGGGAAPQQAPPIPLGNGEPISWTFQPY